VHQKKQLEEKSLSNMLIQPQLKLLLPLKPERRGHWYSTPKWGQGNRWNPKKDTGVLIWPKRKENMDSPGYGLEDRLTAGIGGEITRNIIIPFKAGSYYSGLTKEPFPVKVPAVCYKRRKKKQL
jgi:uncharacterized protein